MTFLLIPPSSDSSDEAGIQNLPPLLSSPPRNPDSRHQRPQIAMAPWRLRRPVSIQMAQSKSWDFPMKNVDFPTKNCDFPMKNCDFPTKNGDFPMKNGDFPTKNGDFPMKNGDFL